MENSTFRLSLCVATFNRAKYLRETLESVLQQNLNGCEIVISDNASTDDTREVALEFSRRFADLKYIRNEVNKGFDLNYDTAVRAASGEYCWLLSDDDLMAPDAVATVKEKLAQRPSLVITNVEARDETMATVIQSRWIDIHKDRVYEPEELDKLFVDAQDVLRYVGCYVVHRPLWLARDTAKFIGTWFIFLGVMFQERLPSRSILIAQPLMRYRKINHLSYSDQYSRLIFEVVPAVLLDLHGVSQAAKDAFWNSTPWKSLPRLLRFRAMGLYSMSVYRRVFRPRLHSMRDKIVPIAAAMVPGAVINALLILYYSITRRSRGVWQPEWEKTVLRQSRYFWGHLLSRPR